MDFGFRYDYRSSEINPQHYRNFSGKSKSRISDNYAEKEKEAVEAQKQNRIDPKLESIFQEVLKDPIAEMADENGYLNHNGVPIFVNNVEGTISIGDVSNMNDVFSVSLSTGYTLNVGRDSISDLAEVIDLFTPEDVKRILYGLQTYKHVNERMDELEDLYSKICENLDKKSSESAHGDSIKSRSQVNNDNESNKSITKSNIVVNADGTRSLLVTTHTAGGAATTFHLKLSETNALDDTKEMKQYEDKFQHANRFETQMAIAAYESE